ncbi:MAG: hypothetical protein AAB911_01960 [Patescibacteria group bacterium]
MLTLIVTTLAVSSLIILFLFFLVYSWDFFTTLKAPFLPISKNIASKIAGLLDIKDDSIVYDLGCGDSRVIIECYKKNPRAKYIGIEKSYIPYILSLIKLKKLGNPKNTRVINGNFFKQNLSQATHVFLYLLPEMMDGLLPKLIAELKQGTIIISFNFVFSKKNPEKTVELLGPKQKHLGLMYIYKL